MNLRRALSLLALALAATRSPAADPNRLVLWNGQDLSGWTLFLGDAAIDPKTVWRAQDASLRLDTKASGYLKTTRSFSNYRLHVEWRWPARRTAAGPEAVAANRYSGVLLHVHGPDAIWPRCFEAQLKLGNAGQVVVNGVKQNRVGKLPVDAGAIALQLEGFPIEFRNVWLEPL